MKFAWLTKLETTIYEWSFILVETKMFPSREQQKSSEMGVLGYCWWDHKLTAVLEGNWAIAYGLFTGSTLALGNTVSVVEHQKQPISVHRSRFIFLVKLENKLVGNHFLDKLLPVKRKDTSMYDLRTEKL